MSQELTEYHMQLARSNDTRRLWSKTFSGALPLNPLPIPRQDHSAERRTSTGIIAI